MMRFWSRLAGPLVASAALLFILAVLVFSR
jgi:hypothetical protein